jgi:hypothetical protein
MCYLINIINEQKKYMRGDRNEDLEYAYVRILNLCGLNREASNLLTTIAANEGIYAERAALELIIINIDKIMWSEIHAMSKANRLLERFAKHYENEPQCVYAESALRLVEPVWKRIDSCSCNLEDFKKKINNCGMVMKIVHNCLQDSKSALIYSEFLLLDQNSNENDLDQAEKLLVDLPQEMHSCIDFIRCQARLMQRKGEYNKASMMWAKLLKPAESEPNYRESSPSENWWRNKYYQLYCGLKAGEDPKNISHAIDVLRSTYSSIPACWAAKLEELQQNIRLQ